MPANDDPGITIPPQRAQQTTHTPGAANPDAPVPYVFGHEIARGGMGSILKAEDCRLPRTVAVKIILSEIDADDAQKQRFINEAAVLARLAHPNIVPVYDIGRDAEGQLYYSMKLVKGRTLKAILKDLRIGQESGVGILPSPQYTLAHLLTIFRKVCDAMAFAHSQGNIHRDLKPENIMVGEFGEVLVMDWGLAKVLHEPKDAVGSTVLMGGVQQRGGAGGMGTAPEPSHGASMGMTSDGMVLGTPQYMSPEQAAGRGADMDARSDIFSLGGILYCILTLRPPVEGKTVEEILQKVVNGEITPLTQKGQGAGLAKSQPDSPGLGKSRSLEVPAALAAVTMKALAVSREKRYQNVAEFSADIEAFQTGFATKAEQANLMKQLFLLIQRHKGVCITAFTAWLIITALAVWFLITITASEHKATRNAELAVKNAETAAENERKATHNAELAANHAALAAKNAEEATTEATRARAAEKDAIEKQEATRRALAKARIAVADAAYRSNNALEMQVLQEVPKDLRDPDWHYLSAKSDASVATVCKGVELTGVAAHPIESGVFAVGGDDGKITKLRARTGEKLLEFEPVFSAPKGKGFKLAFSPDGERIVIGQPGAGIVVYSARDGTKLAEWESRGTGGLSFSTDGQLLLQDIHEHPARGIALWDAGSGRQLWSKFNPDEINDNLHGAVFTPNGKRIVCSGAGGSFLILSAKDGALIRELKPQPGLQYPDTLAMAPDGKMIVAGNRTDGGVIGVSLKDGRVLFNSRIHDSPISHLAFTPDGNRFVAFAVHRDGRQSIQLWNAKTGKPLEALLGGGAVASGLSVDPLSGEMLITGKDSRLWNVTTGPEIWSTKKKGHSAQFWGSDDILFAAKKAESAELWDLRESRVIWEPVSQKVHGFANVSADGRTAVFPGSPLFVLRWMDGKPEVVNEALSTKWFRAIVRLSPDGSKLLMTIDQGRKICEVHETTTGKKIYTLKTKGVIHLNDMGWAADGNHIVGLATMNDGRGASTSEEKIILWDSTTGQQLPQSIVHPTAMEVLVVSPDGLSFAEAGADRLVRVRDAATLAVKQEFRVHDDRITTLAWHPKKAILATGSADLSVKIWNLETGRSPEEFHGLVGAPNAMSFSPGGTRLACSVAGEGTHVWEPVCLKDGQAGNDSKGK